MTNSTKSTITEHQTGLGEIQFMAVARAFTSTQTGKTEFSVKLNLSSGDAAVEHLRLIGADYKLDTKTNTTLIKNGVTDRTVINFASEYRPIVLGTDGQELNEEDAPFFDSRTDKGTAIVLYKVIDYGTNKIVRLSGVILKELTLAPREQSDSKEVTLEKMRNIKL